jgi:small GTP-binding protein
MSEIYQTTYKIIILGDGQVGKTSLIKRFISNEFIENTPMTLGISDYSKLVALEDSSVYLCLWDTAGQERFQSIVPIYFRGCKAAVIVYDVTSEESFKKVQYWINQTRELGSKNIMYMLIGNKIDLEEKRMIKKKDAMDLARNNGMLFFETSCLSALNVELAFQMLTKTLYESETRANPSENGSAPVRPGKGISIILPNDEVAKVKAKKKGCCGKKSN